MSKRNLFFLLFTLGILAVFYQPLKDLFRQALRSELYSHILLIPFVSAYFLYSQRREIDSAKGYSVKAGAILLLAGIVLFALERSLSGTFSKNDALSLIMFSALTLWVGGFVFFYGLRAFRVALFPLLFLLFMIPIPDEVLEGFISVLRFASSEMSNVLFKISGVPFFREGHVFQLTGLTIEVAKECSGIRSSLALVITSVIAGQLFVRTGWKRVVLVLSIFPITVFKNGVRIVMLSLLGAYVDPRILGTELHKSGGIPFFIVALLMLAPVLWLLRRSERKPSLTESTEEKTEKP